MLNFIKGRNTIEINGQKYQKSATRVFIYRLIDPVTHEICYIGQSLDPGKRYRQHCDRPGMYKGNVRMLKWVLGLSEINKKPQMEVIDTIENVDALDKQNGNRLEKRTIKEHWLAGHPLLNGERWMTSRKNMSEWKARLQNCRWYKDRSKGEYTLAVRG